MPGVEAIPEAAFPLIRELGLDRAVALAGGKIVEGFENAWIRSDPVLLPGRWLHIERSVFASAAIQEAVARGVEISMVRRLPSVPADCFAAVDATGRSAAWSRPIHRQGNQVADLFEIPAAAAERGRIERTPDRWMYRIGSTLGVVSTRSRPSHGPPGARYLGRRPAFPQWCEDPVRGRRIAVGDAAFAYDPLAGHGIRFALASAFAAASVIQTWSEKSDTAPASRFYRDFVNQARIRHLEFLDKLELDQPPAPPQPLPEKVRFSGRRGTAELSIESRIVTSDAVLFADQTAVRWLGGVDLLEFEHLARKPVTSAALLGHLHSLGVSGARARSIMSWCLRRGVLEAIAINTNTP